MGTRGGYKLCLQCSQRFRPTRAWQKFCCPAHRNLWHKPKTSAKKLTAFKGIESCVTEFTSPPDLCGVYFLLKGEEVVYVGSGSDVVARITSHRREGVKDFDTAMMLLEQDTPRGFAWNKPPHLESVFIVLLKPRYNVAPVGVYETEAKRRLQELLEVIEEKEKEEDRDKTRMGESKELEEGSVEGS